MRGLYFRATSFVAVAFLAVVSFLMASCTRRLSLEDKGPVLLTFGDGGFTTKSVVPDEEKISDLTLFVFNRDGLMESSHYFKSGDFIDSGPGGCSCAVNLLKGCRYSFYACANMGFRVRAETMDELRDFRFYMAYPDDYRIGIPMSGVLEDVVVPQAGGEVNVPLKRAMAKISVSIDRGRLSDGVEFNVTGLRLCGCPKSVPMFACNSVESEDDIHTFGFSRTGYDVQPLNRNVLGQVSGEASLYMFENLQGRPLGDVTEHRNKVFEKGDPLEWKCSYLELEADYISDEYRSLPGKGLVYRLYLGESPSDFNVERNCHYHITVVPEYDGLGDDGWRVDKSGLEYLGEKYLKVSPGNYIHGHIGDVIHIRCGLKPEWAEFDIGIEELEADRENGIYDYVVDPDGKGVTLTLTGSGGGLLYFEAGEPVNEAAMVVVVSDP
ncbi:MAG: hypothetical protein ACI395_06120 [Candidatus Cryptobacteroides sp.]